MERHKPIPGTFYRHFKGNIYQIKTIAQDSDNCNEVVVYQAMYPPYGCWVRKLEEFMSVVDRTAEEMKNYPNPNQKYRFEQIEYRKSQVEKKENPIVEIQENKRPETNIINNSQDLLMLFLDEDNNKIKCEILKKYRKMIDRRILDSIAVSMDVVTAGKNIEEDTDYIIKCLETYEKYDGGRLRN